VTNSGPLALRAVLLTLLLAACIAGAQEPVWYPPTEPSPFIPDAGRWIVGSNQKTTYFRGVWEVGEPVKRAVLVAAPNHTVRLHLNGRLILEGHSTHTGSPEWADVTKLLQQGDNLVAVKVYSAWRPETYVQMRVEYADGTVEDFATGPSWQWADEPEDDWRENPESPGEWQPVEDNGGYYHDDAHYWGRDFALLPREMLREKLEAHNAGLRESWKAEQGQPGLRIADAPERPEWARQFAGFCDVDEATGQLIDGAGQTRHLFFTIYNQEGALSLNSMDLDQLERDLDLMAEADVHLYMRMLGWGWLLTETGEWAKLEKQPAGAGDLHFERGIDLLDYFVRRAWAHGRYIVFEGDFFWSAQRDVVPPPYRSRYYLYPELLEAQALATRKIMRRYAGCTNVLGMMIGEEDIVMEADLDNPHQKALFTDFLSRKYGTLDEFKRQTRWGYDYADRSGYSRRPWTPERWPGEPKQEVLVPAYTAREGVFDGVQDWSEIPLPHWPWLRSPQQPDVKLEGCTSHNQFSPEDPLWIDFYEMREDELLFDMLCRWVEIVRPALPDQLLFYSNAQDFTSSWHFLHFFRRSELPFDVIGVGCHDSGKSLAQIPPWATVRKAIKVISSYRPYALAPGSSARGIASGEGEGGPAENPEEVRDYYRGALFDEIGGGVAWTQTYTWRQVSGAHGGDLPHRTPLLEWMGEFMPAVQGVKFPLRRPVQVLVVRNTNLAHSNMSGLDYGNARSVAEALTQLNVEFDIVMDRDLVYKADADSTEYKIDLAPYRLVILPSVAIDSPDPVWTVLNAWLRDAPEPGQRALALGWVGKRGPRLEPTTSFHPILRNWLQSADYASAERLNGPQTLTLSRNGGPEDIAVNFGSVPPVGVFEAGEPVISTPEGAVIGSRFSVGTGSVCAFGFPLGFAHEPLWGLEPKQEPRDAAVPIFETLLGMAGVDRPVIAPHNLRVYVADKGAMILIRERAGIKTEEEIAVRIPGNVSYPGLSLKRDGDGYARFRVTLLPWEGKWWKASP